MLKKKYIKIFQGFLPGSRGSKVQGSGGARERGRFLPFTPAPLPPCSLAQNGITKGTAQAVEDGSLQQESLNAFGLLFQDFFNQVVQDEVVAAGEGFDEAGGVLVSLH